jgi:hypothetical protein
MLSFLKSSCHVTRIVNTNKTVLREFSETLMFVSRRFIILTPFLTKMRLQE